VPNVMSSNTTWSVTPANETDCAIPLKAMPDAKRGRTLPSRSCSAGSAGSESRAGCRCHPGRQNTHATGNLVGTFSNLCSLSADICNCFHVIGWDLIQKRPLN
jgi:hypothetical protein